MGLIAEHGCFYKHPAKRQLKVEWIRLADDIDMSYREAIKPLFEHFLERTPGSYLEEKEINVTWHYKNSDPGTLVLI